jgi:hypothetical protein
MQFNENIRRHKKERKLKIKGLQPFQFKGRAEMTGWMAGRMRNRSCNPQVSALPSPSGGESRARFQQPLESSESVPHKVPIS